MGNFLFCRLKKCVRCEQLKHCKPHSAHLPLPYDLPFCDDCWEKECDEWHEYRKEIKMGKRMAPISRENIRRLFFI